MKNLRVGVIGVGGIARTHMPGWKQSKHTEVVAASDINANALTKWGTDHSISKLYQDPLEIRKCGLISDCVYVRLTVYISSLSLFHVN